MLSGLNAFLISLDVPLQLFHLVGSLPSHLGSEYELKTNKRKIEERNLKLSQNNYISTAIVFATVIYSNRHN